MTSSVTSTTKGMAEHLVFVVPGIGTSCESCSKTMSLIANKMLNDLQISAGLQQSTVLNNSGQLITMNGRVIFEAVDWHTALHADIDKNIERITLKNIEKFRTFSRDKVVDVLLYDTPEYCQVIVNKVAGELNRLYREFLVDHPDFTGSVVLVGHSLGSIILFDLLMNQQASDRAASSLGSNSVVGCSVGGIRYPQLCFSPMSFFALGSPLSLFLTVRGVQSLGRDFHLPTVARFYNVFHCLDPVAYRLEPLMVPDWRLSPVLIPHYYHQADVLRWLIRMGYGAVQSVVNGYHAVQGSVIERLNWLWRVIRSIFRHQAPDGEPDQAGSGAGQTDGGRQPTKEPEADEIFPSRLNAGRRVDYMIQKTRLEKIHALLSYVLALTSHSSYWTSSDTIYFILKEIYSNHRRNAFPTGGAPPSARGGFPPSNSHPQTSQTSHYSDLTSPATDSSNVQAQPPRTTITLRLPPFSVDFQYKNK